MTPGVDISELRFLVVEDHGFQRWTMDRQLRELGAKVIFQASNGREAFEIFEGATPPVDVIVTDLNMPGMDGMEFARHIGEKGIPVSIILVSSLDRALLSSVSVMVRAYGIKLLDAIEKPLTAKKLQEALARFSRPDSRPATTRTAFAFTEAQIDAAMRDGDFEPFFQPKVDLMTGAVRGAEALARWHHRVKGLMMPRAFIPAMESTRQIDRFTTFILERSAQACRRWRLQGIAATVSVNVSLISLQDVRTAERYVEQVRAAGLEPRHVVLEITETAAVTQLAAMLENLSRLRMAGFGLALDDYGTGYSSMEQLTRIPFTELKVDQSFVRAAATEPSSRAILESSLEMADKLKIAAVAEGVETFEQAALLRLLGCHMAQGFLIAKPMSESDFIAWAKANGQNPTKEPDSPRVRNGTRKD